MKILAIETSCDETGAALVEGQKTETGFIFKQLGNAALNSQAKLHAEYGGVYPNLARREHEKNLPIILEQALQQTEGSEIDAIAVTQGPGLEPALWAGIMFAEALAKEKNLPLIPTNHMEGHLVSSLVQDGKMENVQLPVLGLLISGGHTEYVLMKNWFEYEVIGETQDDAVGEAFDKVARMLGLPYPGGPEISKLAEHARSGGENSSVKLPRPMIHDKNLNVSFSGLKTAVLYMLRDAGGIHTLSAGQVAAIALEFENAVGDIFISKTRRALEETDAKTFVIGGGVAANKYLRARLVKFLEDEFPNVEMRLPELSITGDNAVMIAEAALARALSGIDDVAKEPVRAYSNRFSILPPK
ncbi:tRNA (adenosine(37)-N6)-threonylcarbamoyltransferase complex transferase subunit TsaD [Candidatus Adlerbacteria bacterium RIFOXYC1_FULL_48_26]|uniref:tRNA N6-adenosine threonylcarbamoyltransferase n=1 Tax=Candidatus Adlerbacteria bacterium RIFOXYC1_FULL_48_26 TaxID=1797247 RepID=A0A1F4Y386_9BACT|nr:MAG: tRNA (adenosine(37)-N6)-threonylcarbamoyltransferase complex transferase subunit TsaD [Candidatus Adlerbacteria bacterium RIFOXYC1_FULL_48_26]